MQNFKKYIEFLTSDQKYFFYVVTILIILTTILEALGISLIIPFIVILLEEDLIKSYPFAENALAILGYPEKKELIYYSLFLFSFFYIFKFFFLLLSANIQSKFYRNLSIITSNRLINGYIKMPYLFHVKTHSSILIRNLTSLMQMMNLAYKMLFNLFSEFLLILLILVFLFIYDFQTTTIFLVIFSAFGCSFYLFNKNKLHTWGLEKVKLESEKLKNITNIFQGFKDIKIFNSEPYFLNRFNKSNYLLNDIERKIYILQQLPKNILEVLTLLSLSAAIYFLLIKTSSNQFNDIVKILGLYGFVALRILPSVNKFIVIFNELKFYSPVINNIQEEMKMLNNNNLLYTENKKNLHLSKILEFKNINFSYNSYNSKNEIFELKDISLKIPRGKKIGIVGESGSGKSTFAYILLGLIKPDSGQIIVDEVNFEYKKNNLLLMIGNVPQDIFLIDDTLMNNVAFGEEEKNINYNQFKDSIFKSQLHTFVDNLKMKEKSIIGELGSMLSGGQKQRIAIARALYKNSEILVLDESTSSLDVNTEQKLVEVFDKLLPEKTLIIITHKYSTIKNCDLIYEFKNGEVIDITSEHKS
jgi:ABC-type bacteriocin/lantibiotic exporter with double-glycine peptidase domain